MRSFLAHALHQVADFVAPRRKRSPSAAGGNNWTGSRYVDSFGRNREPNPNELLEELKGTAWTCASMNASTCATYPPRLYVATNQQTQPQPRCVTTPVDQKTIARIRRSCHLPRSITKGAQLNEVLEHPVLSLFQRPNPVHNAFDLWEVTELYMEVVGSAYWHLEMGPLGIPIAIWPIPAQNMRPKRKPNSPNPVDYYEYIAGSNRQTFQVDEIVHFKFPDPKDPYNNGLSPLRAAYEMVTLASDYLAFREAKFENHAIPDAIVSPKETIGEEERDRLESQWNQQFRRGGAGKILVAESEMGVSLLNHSMGDLAALADHKATKEDICNAFHVPVAFFTTQTNMANLMASERLHMEMAISPRLERRDEKLTSVLLPIYDPSGRLFFASEDPIPVDYEAGIAQQTMDIKYGIVTINEMRSERGLPPVPWGDKPWLPLQWEQTDFERALDAPQQGRNKPRK
jgi:HK97 family phage portal protein